jgi:hypothetical protein
MVKERLKPPYHKNYKQPHIRLVVKQLQFGWFTFKESVCSNNNDIWKRSSTRNCMFKIIKLTLSL